MQDLFLPMSSPCNLLQIIKIPPHPPLSTNSRCFTQGKTTSRRKPLIREGCYILTKVRGFGKDTLANFSKGQSLQYKSPMSSSLLNFKEFLLHSY